MKKKYKTTQLFYNFVVWLLGVILFLIGIFGMLAAFIIPIALLVMRGLSASNAFAAFLMWFAIEFASVLLFFCGYLIIYYAKELDEKFEKAKWEK